MLPDMPADVVNDEGTAPMARWRVLIRRIHQACRGTSWTLLTVVLPLGVVDYVTSACAKRVEPSDAASVIVYSGMGLILAQVALVSIMLVFGAEPFWRRLAVHWGAVFFMATCFVAGSYHTWEFQRGEVQQNVVRLFCSLPAVSLFIQLPLWLVRI